MAHPEQDAHTIFALGLENCAIAVIVDELRQRDPILGVVRAAVTLVEHGDEFRDVHVAGEIEIV